MQGVNLGKAALESDLEVSLALLNFDPYRVGIISFCVK